jgi:hypothetical protein
MQLNFHHCRRIVTLFACLLFTQEVLALPPAECSEPNTRLKQPLAHPSAYDAGSAQQSKNDTGLVRTLKISGEPSESDELWQKWSNQVSSTTDGGLGILSQIVPLNTTVSCMLSFQVTSDGKILNIHIDRASGLITFDNLVLRSVQGHSGRAIMKFPAASKRTSIEVKETFTCTGQHRVSHRNLLAE